MIWQLGLVLFAVSLGFAASGIVTSLYRLLVPKSQSPAAKALHFAVMVFAGPNVLIENAARSRKERQCSIAAFWFAAFVAGYWSLILGLVAIQVGLSI